MNHYKLHVNPEEQRKNAPKAMDDLPHEKKVEAYDVAGLEVLPTSEEMASEEEAKKDLSLITSMKIPTSDADNDKASSEGDSSDQADHQAIIKSSSEDEAKFFPNALISTQKSTTKMASFLVKSGLSYNFVNFNVTKWVGMRESEIEQFDVRVVNGKKLQCGEVVKDVKINVQGV